jgi:futalosine hydrolase
MRILVVAATAPEIAPLQPLFHSRPDIDVLLTGVGMVPTAARCARALEQTRYDLAMNFGICGSFDAALVPGTVVHVVSDQISELGAEDGDVFVPLDGIAAAADRIVENLAPPRNAVLAKLPAVSGITVNTVHGNPASIAGVVARCRPQVESMEGAAFMFACRLSGVPYAQVRAVSNVVERRNPSQWKITEAIDALGGAARAILETV